MITVLAILISVLGFAQPGSDSLKAVTQEQIGNYLKQIADGEYKDESFWALTQLMSSSDELYNDVFETVTTDNYSASLLDIFSELKSVPCDSLKETALQSGALESGSGLLAAAYMSQVSAGSRTLFLERFLRKFPGHSFEELLWYLSEGRPISESVLPLNSFNPALFYLLHNNQKDIKFEEGYLRKFVDTWKNQEIEHPLFHYTLLRAAYNLYLDGLVAAQYDDIITDRFFPNSTLKLRVLGWLEFSLYTTGNYDKAIQLQKTLSLPLAEYLKNASISLAIKRRLGANYHSIGKYQEATKLYEDILTNQNNDAGSVILNNLSISLFELGDSNKYLQTQLQALSSAHKESNLKRQLQIYRNLYVFHSSNKNWSTAESYLDEALNIASQLNDENETARIYLTLGAHYWDSKQKKKEAISALNKGLNLATESNYLRFTNLLYQKALIYFESQDYKTAKSIFEKIKDLALEKSDVQNYLFAQIRLAEIALIEDEIAEVNRIFSEIDVYNLDNVDFDIIVKAKTIEAELLRREGDLRQAYTHLAPTITQIIERSKSSTDFQTGYWNIEPEYLQAFETAAQTLIASERETEALSLLDKLKTINDASFYNNPLIKGNKLTESELTEDKRLSKRLAELRKKLLSAKDSERVSIQSEIDQVSAQKQALLQKVNSEVSAREVPVRILQNKLNFNQVLIHVTELKDQLYKATVTKDDIRFEVLSFAGEIKNIYEDVTKELANGHTDLTKLYFIYDHLRLSALPKNKSEILFIPGSTLYRIPIDILPVEKPVSSISYGAAKYLIEEKTVYYLSSVQEFFRNFRPYNKSFPISINAYGISSFEHLNGEGLVPLPYATKEVQSLSSNLSTFENKQVFTGEEATKERFTNLVSNSKIVHLATHSEVSEQDPLFSTIFLKSAVGQQGEDESEGRLFAYELFNLNLQSDLIVLNSCSSGSGDYMQGTGVMGITRALRYAGARSLMLNLWSVNDQLASEFALRFYEELENGSSKAEAMRQAKLSFLESGNANPHHWGVYMLVGNPSSVKHLTPSDITSYAVLGSFFLIICIRVGRMRKNNFSTS